MKLTKSSSNNGGEFSYDVELPDGTYDADVIAVREDISKNDNEMIVLTFGVNGPNGGKRIDTWVTLGYAPRIQSMIETLASEHLELWEKEGEVDLNPTDMLGRSCRVVIIQDEWDGQERAKIDKLLPLEL